MPAKYQVIMPMATTNLIRNPSVENDLDDWLAQDSVIARSNDEARFGFSSVQVVTNGVAAFEGVQVRSFPNTLDTPYAGSVYVRGDGQVRLRLRDEVNGNEAISDDITLHDDRWLRILDIVGRTGDAPSDNLSIHVETISIQNVTFYVDGAMIEQGYRSTTYIDGDQEGGEWEGAYHASTSIRVVQERSGGRFVDLDEEDLGLYVTVTSGIGMPPVRHNVQGRALLPGVEFQSTKILPRVLQITSWVRNPHACPGALRRLHEIRQNLIDLIKPDVVSPTQPFVLRYNGGNAPVDLDCYYEAGLEFDGDLRNPFFNSFIMRALATDPFWIEDDQQTASLDFSRIINNADRLVARVNGEWERPYDVVPNNSVSAIAQAPNGDIYIGGRFTTFDGVAAVRCVRFDGTNYFPVGTGFNNTVFAIAPAPDGTIYIGGIFTADGPGALVLNYVARYDPITDTIAPLGNGLNNSVTSIAIHPITGDVFIGGEFDDVAGGAGLTLNRITRWDIGNLTFNAMGAGPGLNDDVQSLVFGLDGNTLHVGGEFSEEGPAAAAYPGTLGGIIQYDVDADTFSSMGVSGFLPLRGPLTLVVGDDGTIYAGGLYDTVDGITVNNVAQWNGAQWSTMGDGMNNEVEDLVVGLDGEIVASGDFTEADGRDLNQGIAIWNGSIWAHIDALLSGGTFTVDISLITRFDDLWLGGTFVGPAIVSGITTVDNIGTAIAYPIFQITGPGRLVWLENLTTNRRMYIDMEIQDGEIVTIDLNPANRSVVSDWSGNRIKDILPNSDFATWFLAPGENRILAFIHDETSDTEIVMTWQPTHWSVDGTVE